MLGGGWMLGLSAVFCLMALVAMMVAVSFWNAGFSERAKAEDALEQAQALQQRLLKQLPGAAEAALRKAEARACRRPACEGGAR